MMDSSTEVAEKSPNETKSSVEIKLDNGEVLTFPTIQISRKTLYHGSRVRGLTEINPAEDDTVGAGVYLTSEPMWAAGYAHIRTSNPAEKTVYETEVQDLKLLDLTDQSGALPLLGKFMVQELLKFKERHPFDPNDRDSWRNVPIINNIDEIIKKVKQGTARYPKDLLEHFGNLANNKLSEFGLGGIKAIEGGEGGNGITRFGNHDSYVIFDPAKVKIVKEIPFTSLISA